jgi:hypothetical protein
VSYGYHQGVTVMPMAHDLDLFGFGSQTEFLSVTLDSLSLGGVNLHRLDAS